MHGRRPGPPVVENQSPVGLGGRRGLADQKLPIVLPRDTQIPDKALSLSLSRHPLRATSLSLQGEPADIGKG